MHWSDSCVPPRYSDRIHGGSCIVEPAVVVREADETRKDFDCPS